MFAPWKKIYDKYRQHIKKQRHHFANKGPSTQIYGIAVSEKAMATHSSTLAWKICIQVKKQQLELDMAQWTGSKLGKE